MTYTRPCRRCGDERPTAEFVRGTTRRTRKIVQVCKPCNAKEMSEKRAKQRRYLDDIKLASGCVDCGYNEHAVALDFDHLPGFLKEIAFGKGAIVSKERLHAEIAKCEVVCANCHRVRTMQRRLEVAV